MANILGLALKISADASGVQEKLTPLQRQLQALDKETSKVASVFDKFGSSSAAAVAQQEKFSVRVQALTESLQAGLTPPREYERALAELGSAAGEAAEDLTAAGRIIEANLSREERAQRDFSQSTAELSRLRDAGMLSEEDYARALQRVSGEYAKATLAADKYADEAGRSGDAGVLKFNELSGVLAALPGPIGNVAGRLSGLSSAGEGLSRIFAGGLSQGISGIGASVAGLVNPFTVGIAAVAGLGAAAVSVSRGLVNLEDRVERLSRLTEQLGVSFNFVQVLEEAGRRADVSIEQLSGSFGRLQNTLAGADEESKKASEALARLGVSVSDFSELSQQQQIQVIGEKLATIEDPAQRSAAAIALFGRAGVGLLPFFRELPGASEDVERLGRALNDLDRERIAGFGAGIDALAVATQGLGQTLLLPFAGLGEGLSFAAAEFTSSITAIADVIGKLLAPVLDQIGGLARTFAASIGLLTPVFRLLGEVIEPIGQFLLPAVLAQLAAINRIAIAGAIRSLATTFTAAAVGIASYSAASGVAATATAAFALSIRTLLSSTGIGVLVVAVGLAAQAFVEYAFAAEETVNGLTKTGQAAKTSAEGASAATEQLNKAIENSRKSLDGAINKAGEFGQAGFNAAFEFQQALKELDDQAADKELNADQYARGVANATAEFEKQVESLKKVQEETKRAADEAKARLDADKQVTDQLLEQARINREFDGDTIRAKGAEAVLVVEREIARIKNEVVSARDGNDLDAIAAGEERIRQLVVIRTQQQSIADGSAKAAADERKRLDDQRKSVDELLAAGTKQSQLEQQITAVREQQSVVETKLAKARGDSDKASSDAAAARLAQLDGLRTKLEDQSQAIDQGFSEGFASAFEKTEASLSGLVDKAGEFGAAGAEAAARLQDGVDAVQEQVRDGIISQPVYDREIAQQRRVFEERLKQIEEIGEREKKIREENAAVVFNNQADANDRVNSLLSQQTAAELDAVEQVATRRQQSLFNVEAIENRILLEKQTLEAAREQNDLKSAAAAVDRIDQLKEALSVEQQFSGGRQQQIVDQEQLVADQQNFQEQQQKGVEEYQKQEQQAQQAYAAEQAKIFEEQRKAAEAENKRQEERIRALNTLGQQSIASQDVRTTEGANLVLQLSASGQDPAAIQARLQTKLLEKIALGIGQAAANYFNTPVAIVGAARVGGFN